MLTVSQDEALDELAALAGQIGVTAEQVLVLARALVTLYGDYSHVRRTTLDAFLADVRRKLGASLH